MKLKGKNLLHKYQIDVNTKPDLIGKSQACRLNRGFLFRAAKLCTRTIFQKGNLNLEKTMSPLLT